MAGWIINRATVAVSLPGHAADSPRILKCLVCSLPSLFGGHPFADVPIGGGRSLRAHAAQQIVPWRTALGLNRLDSLPHGFTRKFAQSLPNGFCDSVYERIDSCVLVLGYFCLHIFALIQWVHGNTMAKRWRQKMNPRWI